MRYISEHIENDLKKKMVFLGGPRQVGKTTLTKQLIKKNGLYLNWDEDDDKKIILNKNWSDDKEYLVFDELHKFPRWKNWIKGLYDTQTIKHKILVTGSARLDLYKKGGDSLLGRYHYYRLHPFSLAEFPQHFTPAEVLKKLMTHGGFPEPFLDGNETESRRWRKDRFDRIVKDDIRELEPIHEINNISLLIEQLKARVGTPIVVSNISRDLQVAPNTIKRWIDILEKMYLIFKVETYKDKISRSIQKPFKVYFYDNADVAVTKDEGARFENLVATHLIKMLHFLEDTQGYRCQLCFIRDKDEKEVDFCIVIENKVVELIEVKISDTTFSKNLVYYSNKLDPVRSTQIVLNTTEKFKKNKLTLINAAEDLTNLNRWKTDIL